MAMETRNPKMAVESVRTENTGIYQVHSLNNW